MGSFFAGILGGIIAWGLTMVIGQPLYSFFSLRSDASLSLVMYEAAGDRASVPGWTAEREAAYRRSGASLTSFASTHGLSSQILRRLGFDPRTAGMSLMGLASLSEDDAKRRTLYGEIVDALRLKHRIY